MVLRVYNLAALTLGPMYTRFFLIFGAWWSALGPFAFGIATSVAYVLFRRNQLRAAGVTLVWAIWTAPAWCVITTGGLDSALMIWMAPSPFMAGPLLGRRASVAAGLASVTFVGLMGLAPASFPGVVEMQGPVADPLLHVLCGMTAIGLLAFYGYSTTAGYEDARGTLEATNTALAGLSADLDTGNKAMLRVLDHVDQALVTVDAAGNVSGRWSRTAERWLGTPTAGEPLADLVGRVDESAGAGLRLGFEALADGFLPTELILAQMPSLVKLGEQTAAATYSEIPDGGFLVVLTDVTAQLARQHAEATQSQTLAVFRHFRRDRSGVLTFLRETTQLVDGLAEGYGGDEVGLKRCLHTMKGTSQFFGLDSVARKAHHLEDLLAEGELPQAEVDALVAEWRELREDVCQMIGKGADQLVELPREDLRALARRIADGLERPAAAQAVADLALEPMRVPLENLAAQAAVVAGKVDKPEPVVEVEDHGLRYDRERLGSLFASLIHVVRNAVDHGIEAPDARLAAGKPERGTLRFVAAAVEGGLRIEIGDDGRGVDWERVRAAAEARGLPAATHADLVAALFADGVSTRTEVTELSGRGVGAAAVAEVIERLGGAITVDSTPGVGTRFCFHVPVPRAVAAAPRPELRASA
jgi:two-component system chemotaxis sensor kinase CheA